MKSKNSNQSEQVKSYEAWVEYVDPQGVVTEKQFKNMAPKKKMQIIENLFGQEVTD